MTIYRSKGVFKWSQTFLIKWYLNHPLLNICSYICMNIQSIELVELVVVSCIIWYRVRTEGRSRIQVYCQVYRVKLDPLTVSTATTAHTTVTVLCIVIKFGTLSQTFTSLFSTLWGCKVTQSTIDKTLPAGHAAHSTYSLGFWECFWLTR